MRILCIFPYPPWPLHGGNNIRLYHVLDGLLRHGHDVTLLVGQATEPWDGQPFRDRLDALHTYETADARGATLALRSLLSSNPYPFQKFLTRSLRSRARDLLARESYDAILVNLVLLADAVPPEAAGRSALVIDEGESQELFWRGYRDHGRLGQRWFARLNLAKVPRREAGILARARLLLCVSSEEAGARNGARAGPRVVEIPNGVDVENFRPAMEPPQPPPQIVFTGNMAIRRNVEAAVWFAHEVLPRVRADVPDAQFWIVGRDPTERLLRLRAVPGIHVTGTVDDLRPYYRRSHVAVFPYWFGAGTKLKVLEAMAMGLPIVATPVGVRGIRVEGGVHVRLAEAPAAFAQAVRELLGDARERARLGSAARARAVAEYAWAPILDRLDATLREIVAAPRSAAPPGGEPSP